MRIPINVPDFDLASEPQRLGEWAVEVGDEVVAGECLTEIICPGLALDVTAPASGMIVELVLQPEHAVATGDLLGWMEAKDEST
jgi:pyruvate/2-oxoglutarate dehydrogenase complex dihydrolipoamide acyltransferase (E2) component